MTVYERVLTIGKPFLGPAAGAFISRQCKSHLKIEPAQLAVGHLKELAKWMEVGAGLLMDPSQAAELAKRVAALN